ncbi:unnamed protein product [Albugo candida]|uniref:Uncharacterized protein n=1 Tax=Albugo candida TaxID=65357 RepID=A0A024GLE9_9STRA|nr:unnamed protein product [Albugo candida]|eukprot:CCI47708.1 unnamed protein product [Albugo candida]
MAELIAGYCTVDQVSWLADVEYDKGVYIQPKRDELTISKVGNVALGVSADVKVHTVKLYRSVFCGQTCSHLDIVWKIRAKGVLMVKAKVLRTLQPSRDVILAALVDNAELNEVTPHVPQRGKLSKNRQSPQRTGVNSPIDRIGGLIFYFLESQRSHDAKSCVQTLMMNTLMSIYSVKSLPSLVSVFSQETKPEIARRSVCTVPFYAVYVFYQRFAA